MSKRATKVIHINRHVMTKNRKTGERKPPVIARYKSRHKAGFNANTVNVVDEEGRTVCQVVYRPDKPLNCGATAWIETPLKLVDADTGSEIF